MTTSVGTRELVERDPEFGQLSEEVQGKIRPLAELGMLKDGIVFVLRQAGMAVEARVRCNCPTCRSRRQGASSESHEPSDEQWEG